MNQATPTAGIFPKRLNDSTNKIIIGCVCLSMVTFVCSIFLLTHVSSGGADQSSKIWFYAVLLGIPLFPLMGAILLGWNQFKFGRACLFLDAPVQAGGILVGKIKISKKLEFKQFEFVSLKLKCVRKYMGIGRNMPTREETLKTVEANVTRGKIITLPDGTTEIPVHINIPAGQPAGSSQFGDVIEWKLEAEAMPNRGQHFAAAFNLKVAGTK
jgi:hypothetical protein